MYAPVYMYVAKCVYMYACVCVYVCICVCMCVYVAVCVYMYACVCGCVYMCMSSEETDSVNVDGSGDIDTSMHVLLTELAVDPVEREEGGRAY